MRVDDLTALDLRCMEALTTTRTTASVVTLAATMWQGWADADMRSDPVGLVQYVVETLAERGLVTYRLHEHGSQGGEHRPYAGLAHTIRLTKVGWDLMGYPNVSVQVGTRMSSGQMLDPKGDRTNHRKHGKTAEGGDIERLPWPEHRAKYPTHTHPLMEGDTVDIGTHPGLAPIEDGKTRAYIKVTPDLEARVIAYRTRFPLVDYAELGRILDLPERTIKYILTDLPRLRATNDAEARVGTIKQRIMWTLAALDMKNVTELRRVLGRNDTAHDIVHALHDLHTQGKVDFREDGAHKQPVDIRLTKRGRGEGLDKKVKDAIEQANAEADAIAPEPTVMPAQAVDDAALDEAEQAEGAHTVKPEAEASSFPLLDALLAREQQRMEQDNKAFKYLEAAESIKDVDPVMYSALVEKADSSIPFPSPIEAEYLRYVAACPGGGSDD